MSIHYASRRDIELHQEECLSALLKEILPANRFYADKFRNANVDPAKLRTLNDWNRVPFTTKAELLDDQQQHEPYGSRLTYPLERYFRFHQTSGTTGRPLRWLDTCESWQWALDCWKQVYDVVGVQPSDRLFFPFSFGPFYGFWTAFEAAVQEKYFCLAAGGMSSAARLRMLTENAATIVLCTPTYALRLAEVAAQENVSLDSVRALIVAGEPGGSIPATRERIEKAWQARVFDHSGLTEIGPLTVECPENPSGLHILEGDYFVEIIDRETGKRVPSGDTGEMVVTNFGRTASPLLRYRTGDVVRVDARPCPCGRTLVRLEGGILGRVDDMIHLRGNNIYPAALEGVIRRFSDVVEYRIIVDQRKSLPVLRIEIEPNSDSGAPQLADHIRQVIRDEFLYSAEVKTLPHGSLPRFEMKAKRVVFEKG